MMCQLFFHKPAFGMIIGFWPLKFPVLNGHIRPDGAGIGTSPDKRQGDFGVPGQKKGMKAYFGSERMDGGIAGMGCQNCKLFIFRQAVGILNIDFFVIADQTTC